MSGTSPTLAEIVATAGRLASLCAQWAEEQERKDEAARFGVIPRNLSVAEAARILGVHPSTVRHHVLRGSIPHVKIGARILIPEDELREWMRTQRAGGNDGRKRTR